MVLPILQDYHQSVYGSTYIQMMHMCGRYQPTVAKDRMNMIANATKLQQLFSTFDQRVRPVTKRIRTMLMVQKFGLSP